MGGMLSGHTGRVLLYAVVQVSTVTYGPCILFADARSCVAPARSHQAERRAVELISSALLVLGLAMAAVGTYGMPTPAAPGSHISSQVVVATELARVYLMAAAVVVASAVSGLLSVRTSELWFMRSFRLSLLASLVCFLVGVLVGGNVPRLRHDGSGRWFWVSASSLAIITCAGSFISVFMSKRQLLDDAVAFGGSGFAALTLFSLATMGAAAAAARPVTTGGPAGSADAYCAVAFLAAALVLYSRAPLGRF
jgi:hypothetical protein